MNNLVLGDNSISIHSIAY